MSVFYISGFHFVRDSLNVIFVPLSLPSTHTQSFYFFFRFQGNISFYLKETSDIGQKPLRSKYDFISAYTTFFSQIIGSCGFPITYQSATSLTNSTSNPYPSPSPTPYSPFAPSQQFPAPYPTPTPTPFFNPSPPTNYPSFYPAPPSSPAPAFSKAPASSTAPPSSPTKSSPQSTFLSPSFSPVPRGQSTVFPANVKLFSTVTSGESSTRTLITLLSGTAIS